MSLTTGEKWQKIRETYERRRYFRIWLVGNPEELGYQKNNGYGEPRKIFDRALKVYIAMLKKREEKSRMIKEHLESIKNLLG